jgi:hypothetical protein
MSGTAYLAGYDHDLFVSYVHEPTLGDWTARLRDELSKALNLILYLRPPGPVVDIWIDQQLRNNVPLSDELKKRVESSALLLIVMSPFYLGSGWCGKETEWFAAAARSRIASGRRVFVVQAQPTEKASWPALITELPGYKFFARHQEAQVDLPLGSIGDKNDEVAFKQALYTLAGQIKLQIDELIKEGDTPPTPPTPVVVRLTPQARAPLAPPARLVCVDALGGDATHEAVREIHRILRQRNADVFIPSSLGPAPRDPVGAERYLQRLTRAKAQCDGLILLRLGATSSPSDWLLEYLGEIRPAARRMRPDASAPAPLLIDAAAGPVSASPEGVAVLRRDDPQFEAQLAAWIDNLPVAREEAA